MTEKIKSNGIEIKRIDPKKDVSMFRSLAKVYAEVFAGPPWNEYTICPSSQKFFGKETKIGGKCPECSALLSSAYPLEETGEYILKELSKKDSALFIGESENKLVAFSWGYSYPSPEKFTLDKYKTREMQTRVNSLLRTLRIGEFYYFSESGILEEFRGRGLTNDFYRLRLQVPKELDLPVLVRTLCVSPIVVVAQKFGFEQIMGPIPEIDRELRTIRPTERLANDFGDSEIENRVLLMLQSNRL